MLDIDDARFVRLISQDIGLLSGLVIMSLEDTVNYADQKSRRPTLFYPDVNERAEIQREGINRCSAGFSLSSKASPA